MLYIVNDWNVVWRDCIVPTFRSIYEAMNSIVIVSLVDGARVSLWDFCIGIIIMGAIINLFINFTVPTIPDRSSLKQKTNKKE